MFTWHTFHCKLKLTINTNQIKFWFLRRGETEVPGENPSVQRREPTNSTHIRRRVEESNPGHIGEGRVLSLLRHPCTPFHTKGWLFCIKQLRLFLIHFMREKMQTLRKATLNHVYGRSRPTAVKLVYGLFTDVCFFFIVIGVEVTDQLSVSAYEPE